MTRLRQAGGYSIAELMFTLALLTILAAVAYPSLIRAHSNSIEVSSVSSLRMILRAQAVFAATCAGGFYAPSISWLAREGGPGREAFIGPDLDGNIVDRRGYRIRFTAGPAVSTAPRTCNGLGAGRTVRVYFVAADPLETTGPASVGRHFGLNAGGVVFQSPKRVRPVFAGSPPPPAKPLQ
ncbi:MAG TPA: hypothetical protein VI485_13450 [Vicinamibacterales bacterium]|nr:hypothetical protein [Vicinamibacterales bacterium]